MIEREVKISVFTLFVRNLLTSYAIVFLIASLSNTEFFYKGICASVGCFGFAGIIQVLIDQIRNTRQKHSIN